MATIREQVERALRVGRIYRSLRAKGINVERVGKNHYYNFVVDCYGRLQDCACKRVYRTEVSGATFGIKEMLKAAGFRWDAEKKVWHSREDFNVEFGGEILRSVS